MASNAPGRKGPVIARTSTRKKSPAANAKKSSASAAAPMTEAAPAPALGSPISDAATTSRCTPTPAPDPDADILLQMLSSMATPPVTFTPQVVSLAVSPAADEERPAPFCGKSVASRNFLAKSRGTGTNRASAPEQRAEEEALALRKLNEFAHAAPPPTAVSPSPSDERRRWRGRCARVAVALLGVAALTVALALLVPSRAATRGANPAACITTGCVDHAENLGLHRKGSAVGPCEDIGTFVCSRWIEEDIHIAPSVTIYRMDKWLYNLARSPWYEAIGNRVAARVTRLVDACMHRESQTGNHHDDGVQQLYHFMTEKLFPWLLPDTNRSGDGDRIRDDGHRIRDDGNYAFTLATIVNMSVVWYVPLWFTVDLVTPSPGYGASPAHRSVSISSTNVVDIAQRIHFEVEAYKLYDAYVSLLLEVVFRGGEFSPDFRSFLRDRSAEVQRDVLGNLSSRFVASRVEPRFLQMRHLPALVPKLDARDWVDAMQSAFGANPPLTEEDTLFVTDSGLLHAVNVLFASYTARELTYHTAWWFVQVVVAVTSDTMHAFVMGNKAGDQVYPVMCGSHIAMAYNVLLAGLDRGTGTASANRTSPVTRLLSNVHETAVGKVRTWTNVLGSQAIDAVSSRLGSTTTVVWPEGNLNESDGAWWGEALYGPDYDNTTRGFFGHWTEIRQRLRASLNTDAYQSGLRVFRLQSSNLATYDAVSNAISVGVFAATRPFYAADGTSAMNYGGLGFLYALQVVQTINTLTLLLDGDRTPSAWVPPTSATDASGAPGQQLWKLGRCASPDASDHVTSLYPVLPALEIAHDAYRRFRNVAQDVPLRGLEAYSAEQVFFLTACHVTCWTNSSGHRMSPECTDAMSNFAPFADAFGCPAGSPMNPRERCRFF
ncbi:uncharacterized protein LOC142560610 [Dermacentor variabilis]|uniref:uncharacterized protein LOC142560610 n=1 Tax=Dermacentor variabilis TaxID=34621 RepID=UPI003F5BC2FC